MSNQGRLIFYVQSSFCHCFELLIIASPFVVYFDQQMGAPHTIRWSKSFATALKQVFLYFPSLTEEKERKKKESTKIKQNQMISTSEGRAEHPLAG